MSSSGNTSGSIPLRRIGLSGQPEGEAMQDFESLDSRQLPVICVPVLGCTPQFRALFMNAICVYLLTGNGVTTNVLKETVRLQVNAG